MLDRPTVKLPTKPHEKMRIAGKLVDADAQVEVFNPYTGAVVGTVPAADPRQWRRRSGWRTPTSRSSRATTARRS